jgi:hypothetical protein
MDTLQEAANRSAATIVNLMGLDCPKAELYGRIFRLLYSMMCIVSEEQAERWRTPSQN